MPQWLPSALIGLIFGLAVSGLNHLILRQGTKRVENLPPQKASRKIIGCYAIRYVLNIAALFIVRNNVPMLIATAIGLTGSKYVLMFQQRRSKSDEKGVN